MSAECAHCGLPVPVLLEARRRRPRTPPPADARADALTSLSLSSPATSVAMSVAPPDAAEELPFCCEGCRTVWHALHDNGLERYYALREAGAAGPARSTGRSYAELDDTGFLSRSCRPAPGGLLVTQLYLEGVSCAACVWVVERLPQLLPGVAEMRLDLPRSRATVAWDPSAVRLSRVASLLDSFGYPAHPFRGADAERVRRREDRALLMRIGLAGAAAANVMAIAFALYGGILHGMEPEFQRLFRWASLVITTPSLLWGGSVFFRGAWRVVRSGRLHMDLPISIGLAAGFLHGAVNTLRGRGEVYFDSVATLTFLLLVGRYLQRRQQRAAGDATELLASLAPSTARLVEGEEARDVPLESLLPGMLVEVRAGDVVPADGVVLEGVSTLDLSLLSGESRPVEIACGDAVHAGTLNLGSRLIVRVETTGEGTRVGRLLSLVEEHARRRAPIVQLADRISGAFVAAVLVLAAVTAWIWMGRDPGAAFDHTIALLVVTCPCALGLATPLALSVAIGQAARAGILVKGADVLEKLAGPGHMWLDKTGTLTEGRVALLRWVGDEAARGLTAAVEAHSSHPVARALTEGLGGAPHLGPLEVAETLGGGMEGRIGRQRVVVGSPPFVAARGAVVPTWAVTLVDAWAGDALTPVLVAVDGAVVAAAALGDPLREDARASLARIRRMGWTIGILSGDDARVVRSVASAVGVDAAAAHGRTSPEEKLAVVERGVAHGPVVMVGDGVNDAAALAAAGVGIGMHGGAEAALTAADVSITRPGTRALVDLLEGAARSMRVVRRNLVISLVYNVVGVALAMSGLINPLVAAILMPLSSITVIASSYRARMFRPGGVSA